MSEPREITLHSLLSDLLDFVYPPQCHVCGNGFVAVDENIWLCESCRNRMQEMPLPVCPVCHAMLPDSERSCVRCRKLVAIKWLYALGSYDEYYSHLIKSLKYLPRPGIAKLLARMLADRLREFPHTKSLEAVCAVPIHAAKETKRGFNQAELIAEEIARELEIEYTPRQLVQVAENRDQIGLNLEQRYRNVQGNYAAADGFALKGKAVLIIDDVTTSGATLNATAMALMAAGAKSVAAATIAMALEDGLDSTALYQLMWEEF